MVSFLSGLLRLERTLWWWLPGHVPRNVNTVQILNKKYLTFWLVWFLDYGETGCYISKHYRPCHRSTNRKQFATPSGDWGPNNFVTIIQQNNQLPKDQFCTVEIQLGMKQMNFWRCVPFFHKINKTEWISSVFPIGCFSLFQPTIVKLKLASCFCLPFNCSFKLAGSIKEDIALNIRGFANKFIAQHLVCFEFAWPWSTIAINALWHLIRE